jgi:hypothetical protein
VTNEKLTVPEKLLLASLEARKRGATFTAEDLVVEAWRKYPDTFGLSGYSELYPDSNRVLTNIMGTKGMRGKGWLRKVGEKQYQLTSAALSQGQVLLSQIEGAGAKSETRFLRAELDRQATAALARIISTPAARKALTKQTDALTFNDACGFWDITVRSNANTLSARLAEATVLLDRAQEASAHSSGEEGLKIGNASITQYQIETLVNLNLQMQEMFKSELDILRRRTDERVEKRAKHF